MAVTIRRTPPQVEVKVELPPVIKAPVVVPNLSQIVQKKAESGLPKGRNYRNNRGTYNVPQKTLAQILPKRYNSGIVVKPESIASTARFCRCDYCRDTGKVTVYDICESCDGAGCAKCDNTGEIKNLIPCQECKKRKT